MLFLYKAINSTGGREEGNIDAFSIDSAILSLQKRGLVISSIKPKEEDKDILHKIPFFNRVSNKDIVILSRQISTLFEAQVSALRVFKMIATEVENPILRTRLLEVVNDLQGGNSISTSLAKHPDIFSNFYVNMVKAGEESGHIDEAFAYMADYLDRNYEVTTKARNALIYPAFVIVTFIAVMALMFTVIIPKISVIIEESGQDIPIYTKIVLGVSHFFVDNIGLLSVAFVIFVAGLIWYIGTPDGKRWLSNIKLSVPYVGDLYRKLYLSRLADNMSTMVGSGIPMLRALEVTSEVIDNDIYKMIISDAITKVKSGSPLSASIADKEQIPSILSQMIKVGEESGELGSILKSMAKFYQREVVNAVDTLVGLIEPVMIVLLGVGVGILLASVLMPIYNVASSVS